MPMKKILKFLETGPKTRKEISTELGWSKYNAYYYLTKLVDSGEIKYQILPMVGLPRQYYITGITPDYPYIDELKALLALYPQFTVIKNKMIYDWLYLHPGVAPNIEAIKASDNSKNHTKTLGVITNLIKLLPGAKKYNQLERTGTNSPCYSFSREKL
jgi:hypothetical protein